MMERRSEPIVITSAMLARPVDRRVDFERGMRQLPRLTMALMVSLVAVYGWQMMTSVGEKNTDGILAYALVRARVLDGEWWRMLSSAFLHGGPDHLIGNLISLYILGMAAEHALGLSGLAVVYLVSALGGAAMSMALSPGPSIGASGAIFGLMGAVVLFMHKHRDRMFVRDKRIGVVIAVWAGYTLFLGSLSPVIDNGAHLGGLITGALAALVLPSRLLKGR